MTMLIVVYGPSGVGKSVVMRRLVEAYGWRRVRTVSTRPNRCDEDRLSVSEAVFSALQSDGRLAHINYFYGHYYASMVEDLVEGSKPECKEKYVVDMSVERPLPRDLFPHLAIVILPRDEEQLRQQLRAAQRDAREGEALIEYRAIYIKRDKLQERLGDPTIVLTNSGSVEAITEQISATAGM